MAVIAPFKFDDFVTAGKATGQANGAHRRFGTGVHHPHHIHRGDQFGHQLRHFDFHFRRRAKAQAAFRGFNHRVANGRMVMAQYHGSPGADIIDIRFTVDIVQPGAVGAFDKQRCTADAAKGADRRVHAAGDEFTCGAIECFRFAHCHDPGS